MSEAATGSASAGRVRSRAAAPPSIELILIYLMWSMLFFEFHNYLPTLVGLGPVIRRIPILLMLILMVVAIARVSKRSLYWPYAVFVLLHFLELPFVLNRGLAMIGFKTLLLFFVPFTATLAVVRKPHQVETLFKIFVLSFPWYCVQGVPGGLIRWHNLLGNPDAFGPLGVMATAIGYFFALSAREKKWRRVGMATAGLGIIAMVASFARGAFVSGAMLAAVIFYRSKRKARVLGQGLVAAVVLIVAAEIIFPGGAFWEEMATIAAGTNEGTGASRWELWTGAGLRVFAHSPIFGVGANNTGPVAGQVVPFGAMAGKFADPAVLYNKQMHNVYVQLLAEQGLVGVGLWGYMLVTFFKRNIRLRTREARARWRRAGGEKFDIYYLSLGLEASMIVFLTGGIFYNQVYRHWFYTLILFSLLLEATSRARGRRARTKAQPEASSARAVARPRGPARPSVPATGSLAELAAGGASRADGPRSGVGAAARSTARAGRRD